MVSPSRAVAGLAALGLASFLWIYRGLLDGSALFSKDAIGWYGAFSYYLRCLGSGVFPYWNPYDIGGTPFYPGISHLGLLDPVVLGWAGLVRLAGLPPLRAYVYFRLLRLVLFGGGCYLLFHRATRCRAAALFGAVMLILGLAPTSFYQSWVVDVVWLAPYSMTYLLGAFDGRSPGPKRAVCALGLALTTGGALNVYIPSFHLFNLLCFSAVAVFTGLIPGRRIFATLRCRRNWPAIAGAAAILALLAAPPAAVFLRDLSPSGELFPVQRVLEHRGYQIFRQLVASKVEVQGLSPAFLSGRGTFYSFGGLADLLNPGATDAVDFFRERGLVGDVHPYLGMGLLFFAGLAALRAKSGYRTVSLTLLVVVMANVFTFSDAGNAPFNGVQEFFNLIFPPLAMVTIRELLASYLALYLALLAATGMRLVLRPGPATRRSGDHTAAAVAIGFLLLSKTALSIALTGTLFVSSFDAVVSAGLVGLCVLLLGVRAVGVSPRWLAPLLAALALADLLGQTLVDGPDKVTERAEIVRGMNELARVAEHAASQGPRFAWFREPLPRVPSLGFVSGILSEKSLISSGINHTLFTTKRYYDVLVNLPLDRQFAIGGIAYPVARFYPAGEAYFATQEQALRLLAETPFEVVSRRLCLELPTELATPLAALDLDSALPAAWLRPDAVKTRYRHFSEVDAPWVRNARADPSTVLKTGTANVDVASFGPNHATFQVWNTTPGYLAYADGWSRYWEATDNGRPVPVYPANYNGKGVYLAPGRHEVTMTFDPVHFRLALWAYHVGLVLGLVWLVWFWVADRRQKGPQRRATVTGQGGKALALRPGHLPAQAPEAPISSAPPGA